MSQWLPERLRPARPLVVGLDGQAMAWRESGTTKSHPAAAGPSALVAAQNVRHWHLVAGLGLAVHWLQVPPRGVRSLRELRQVAAVQCAHLHGAHPEDWWIAAEWNAHCPFVCAAVPRQAADPWVDEAAGRGVQLHVLTTWLAACAVLSPATPAAGWSGLRTPSRTMVWHCSLGRVDCLVDFQGAHGNPAREAEERAAQQIRLACLRQPHLSAGLVQWLGDSVAGAATEADAALHWGSRAAGEPA